MTAEGDRVAGFGRLEDGLRRASPWCMWGPYVRDRPYALYLDGTTATIDYEPAESTTSLGKYYGFFGNDLTVEYPAGSGNKRTLAEIAGDLRDRLISIFTRSTADGRRPCFGWVERPQHDPRWRDNIYFRRHGAVRETVDLVGDLIDLLE